ncbi:WD40 repeat domain-containing protein [Streptomyces tsukubensis]|uniref:WD40 repeat domain-containing protein n=1 Tax=Streptomyces tsukubensis TaxID=83656 RepID=UPI0036AC4E9A
MSDDLSTGEAGVESVVADVRLTDPGFLVHGDPAEVLGLADAATAPAGRLAAAVYRASAPLHRDAGAGVRRQLLALDAARYGNPRLSAAITAVPVDGEVDAQWGVEWATGSSCEQSFGRPRFGHGDQVKAVATTVVGGRPTAVTAGFDGRVGIWDLETGQQTGELVGDDGRFWTVGTVLINDRPHAVTGSDWSVRLWDLTTGQQVGEPLPGIEGEVWTVATAVVDGRPHAVAGDDDTTVRVWDLTTGAQVGKLTGHDSGLMATATMVRDGRPHIVGSMDDGTVWVWDLTTGQRVGEPLSGIEGEVWTVTTAVVDGRPHAVTAGFDATVRVWDLTTGLQVGELTGHDGQVCAVVSTVVEGLPRAVTGGSDGTVRVWDLTTGRPVGTESVFPLPVIALAPAPEGRLVVGFGSDVAVLAPR